jgi:hypothetical protein
LHRLAVVNISDRVRLKVAEEATKIIDATKIIREATKAANK